MVSKTVLEVQKSAANFILDALDNILGVEAATDFERRRSFIAGNLIAGGIGVLLWPLYWAVFGPVSWAAALTFIVLWSPLALALWVKNGGELESAEGASALVLAAGIAVVTLFTGGIVSPALPWLLVVPLEAALVRRKSALTVASLCAVATFVLCAGLAFAGWLPSSLLEPSLVAPAYAVSMFAALVVAALSLRSMQNRHWQERTNVARAGELFRSTVEHSPDLITRHLANGTVVYASPSAENLLGIPAGELEGLSPAMIVHIQDLKHVETSLARTFLGEPQVLEFRLRRRNGSYVPVEMRAQAIDGEIIGVIREMTARNNHVGELMRQRDSAERTSQARLRFLASVTHELRTPLNAIIGFSDMMRNEIFGPVGHAKYKEYADHIRESGLHLVEVVSDLLDMSKIEAGKFSIERKPLEIKPLCDEAVAMVAALAQAAGVRLVSDVPNGLMLQGDRRALKQCLINLLSNAIKFTLADGEIRLTVTDLGESVAIAVADTGVGMPEQDIARIGRPFEQIESGHAKFHKGTGLGLSLVKALSELHDGSMKIQSALGDGTVVTLTIPRQPQIAPVKENLVYPEKFRVRAS